MQHMSVEFLFFFFQAEDGIRDHCVTGVQTCALPIYRNGDTRNTSPGRHDSPGFPDPPRAQIGRASCRERVYSAGVAAAVEKEERDEDMALLLYSTQADRQNNEQ